MIVDEDRKFVLTKYSSTKGARKVVESDHNPLICKLVFKWNRHIKPIRKEIFNIKDPDGLLKFQYLSSNCSELV